MLKAFSAQAAAAGLLAAVVGFASSFAVILRGLAAMGATQQQAASGLMAAAIAMGLGGVVLSLRSRQPISVAWSTPGAALLASTGGVAGGFSAAVGAFLVANALIVAAGLWRPLGRAVAAIPPALANAMLAGVLLGLCLAPVRAVAEMPMLALPVVLAWAFMARVKRLYAVPAAVLVALVLLIATAHGGAGAAGSLWPAPVLPVPHFSVAALLGVALPLFIVTMASQNIPGIAVLHANGYRPAPGKLFWITGLFGLAGRAVRQPGDQPRRDHRGDVRGRGGASRPGAPLLGGDRGGARLYRLRAGGRRGHGRRRRLPAAAGRGGGGAGAAGRVRRRADGGVRRSGLARGGGDLLPGHRLGRHVHGHRRRGLGAAGGRGDAGAGALAGLIWRPARRPA